MMRGGISPQTARRIYDRLAAYYDWADFYESRAKARAFAALNLAPGQHALNAGVGTGTDHARLQAAVAPGGMVVGFDMSSVMLGLTRARTGSPVCQGDIRHLPFRAACFDRLFCAYVLDLIPGQDLPGVLAEFHRVLKPDGRMVLVTSTEGVTGPSRALVSAWKLLYALSPVVCGGCRPLQAASLVRSAGFRNVTAETVVQWFVPSQVIVADP